MILFTGTESYPGEAESSDPGFAPTLIYYLGDISDSWHNFANVSIDSRVYIQRIARFGKVEGL